MRGALAALLAGLGIAGTPLAAGAQSKCAAAKLEAAGAYFDAVARCESKGAAKGAATDALCVAKAQSNLASRFAKAERKDDCLALGDTGPAQDVVDDGIGAAFDLLEEGTAETCCMLNGGACTLTLDAATCTNGLSGVAGAAGTVCDIIGACVPAPGVAGPCCARAVSPFGELCLGGVAVPKEDCENLLGHFSEEAMCHPTGLCAAPGGRPRSRCTAARLKAAGRYYESIAGCEAKAAAKGGTVDVVCLGKAESKLDKAFAKSAAKDDCMTTADGGAAQSQLGTDLADLFTILEPPPAVCCATPSLCLWVADAAVCQAFPGVVGAAGTVCSGDGTCAPPPAAEGPCCDAIQGGIFDGKCASGAAIDPPSCAGVGGSFVGDAVCLPAQVCID
jgi:hypothetical protein